MPGFVQQLWIISHEGLRFHRHIFFVCVKPLYILVSAVFRLLFNLKRCFHDTIDALGCEIDVKYRVCVHFRGLHLPRLYHSSMGANLVNSSSRVYIIHSSPRTVSCASLHACTHLPSLSLHVHDQLGREGPRHHEVLLVEVSVGRCRHGVYRHKDPLRTVQRAEYFFAELWARGSIAIVAGGGLRLLLHGTSHNNSGRSRIIAEERIGREGARGELWAIVLIDWIVSVLYEHVCLDYSVPIKSMPRCGGSTNECYLLQGCTPVVWGKHLQSESDLSTCTVTTELVSLWDSRVGTDTECAGCCWVEKTVRCGEHTHSSAVLKGVIASCCVRVRYVLALVVAPVHPLPWIQPGRLRVVDMLQIGTFSDVFCLCKFKRGSQSCGVRLPWTARHRGQVLHRMIFLSGYVPDDLIMSH